MKKNEKDILKLIDGIDTIIASANEFEKKFKKKIEKVNPDHTKSAINLIHYLALRKHDISELQESLGDFGLNPFGHIEPHVMRSLLLTKAMLQSLIGEKTHLGEHKTLSVKRSRKLLNRNTAALFGKKPKKRRARIMVTLPSEAAADKKIVEKFLKAGMNCARINCAHDNPELWNGMINNVRDESHRLKKDCKISMDLAGPKFRTGKMVPGPKVLHIRPGRDELGNITKPVKVWLTHTGGEIPAKADVAVPVDGNWLKSIKKGDVIEFEDSRGKFCKLEVVKKQGDGRWALSYDSTYITTGTEFVLKKKNQTLESLVTVGELLPLEQWITLKPGDFLVLHKKPLDGENAVLDENGSVVAPAHISCEMPEIFDDVKAGEPVLFDDGKIEGIIETANPDELVVLITGAKPTGSKLKGERGINFPDSSFSFSGLTKKDIHDMDFVVENADIVNVSFVNDANDVKRFLEKLKSTNKQPGVILKIETRKGFQNLPLILLEAMQLKMAGVMIARGDLAVEAGWNNMAILQEEILRVCEAAHIPDVWATQVLEEMSKKGIPSRAELTDAGMSQRAECVMLNKGPHITKAIKMLDKILRKMQEINKKKENILPPQPQADQLFLQIEYEKKGSKKSIN